MYSQQRLDDSLALSAAISPWSLDLQQLQEGRVQADLEMAALPSVLLSRSHWSHRTLAAGTTPPGFLFIGGIARRKPYIWRGGRIDSGTVAFSWGASQVEYMTPKGASHWVVLIPLKELSARLGPDFPVERLQGKNFLHSAPPVSRKLRELNAEALALPRTRTGRVKRPTDARHLQDQLFDTVIDMLYSLPEPLPEFATGKRYQMFQQSVHYARRALHPVTVQEICQKLNVSQRVLQLSFQEVLGMPPQRYLRWNRLTKLRLDLAAHNTHDAQVASLMLRWGFKEPGRTAVEYKQLFGESPSDTLNSTPPRPHSSYLDLLHAIP